MARKELQITIGAGPPVRAVPWSDAADAPSPLSPRVNEHHIGTRFGDRNDAERDGRHWHITLDGVRVESWTVELEAGRKGWIRAWAHPEHDGISKQPYVTEGRPGGPTLLVRKWTGEVRAWTCDARVIGRDCEREGPSE